mmetsp:Transcript_106620/g.299574  ORF Transcript_106620/g.299574 Transcript_106620/m.299574 type:complete len:255 (-) Transcript_106620:255-1019(-)
MSGFTKRSSMWFFATKLPTSLRRSMSSWNSIISPPCSSCTCNLNILSGSGGGFCGAGFAGSAGFAGFAGFAAQCGAARKGNVFLHPDGGPLLGMSDVLSNVNVLGVREHDDNARLAMPVAAEHSVAFEEGLARVCDLKPPRGGVMLGGIGEEVGLASSTRLSNRLCVPGRLADILDGMLADSSMPGRPTSQGMPRSALFCSLPAHELHGVLKRPNPAPPNKPVWPEPPHALQTMWRRVYSRSIAARTSLPSTKS